MPQSLSVVYIHLIFIKNRRSLLRDKESRDALLGFAATPVGLWKYPIPIPR